MDPAGARYVTGAYPVWIVPGTEVCIVTTGRNGPREFPGATCNTVAAAEQGKVCYSSVTEGGAPIVVGLAPDGDSVVTVTEANGSTVQAPVTDNVYEISSGDPVSVTLTTASGASVTLPVAVPAPPLAHKADT